MKKKPLIKSFVLSVLVVLINFIAYFTYRLIGFGDVTLIESLGYTFYVSIMDFTSVFIVSYLFFRREK